MGFMKESDKTTVIEVLFFGVLVVVFFELAKKFGVI